MLKKSGQQKLQPLPKRPSVTDLKQFMVSADKDRSSKFSYFWKTEDKKAEFMLSLKMTASMGGGAFEWRLYSGSGPDARELWYHYTSDAGQIYSMIVNSTGETVTEATQLDAIDSPPALAEVGKKSSSRKIDLGQTFDRVPLDEMMRSSLSPESVLKGNLEVVQISNLLQSIYLGEMTGRLRIQREAAFADVFFEDGKPVHAEGSRGIGEDCLLQAICWNNGEFGFEQKLKTDERTINRNIDALIMDGLLLLDHTDYLKSIGVMLSSVLAKTNANLTEAEFEALAATGEPLDLGILKSIYLSIDSRRTLEEIIIELRLVRSKWVPLIANLFKLKVINLMTAAPASANQNTVGKVIDNQLVDSVRRTLVRQDTGINTFAAILYLLDEQIRLSDGHPISVVLMEMQPARTALVQGKSLLSPQQVQQIARRIGEISGFKGIVGHYEHTDLIWILPHQSASLAAKLADRLIKSLLSGGQNLTSNLVISIGISCHPEHVCSPWSCGNG